MEPTRFDRLTQALSLATSRRTALAALLGGLLQEVGVATAHHRRKRRRRRAARRATRQAQAQETAQARSLLPLQPSGPTGPIVPGGPTAPGLPPDRICRAICPGCCVGAQGATCVTCANPTPICGNRTCAACTSGEECVAAGKGNICCGGSCFTGICCASADCVNPFPLCTNHLCAACSSAEQCAATGKGNLCCSGSCFSATDPDNCGGCGHVCSGTTPTCWNGACVCGDVCASGCQFNSVQAAIDAASPGATIRVCAGYYFEANVTIDKDLTLIGVGANATTLDARRRDRVMTVISGVVGLQGLRLTRGNAQLGGGIYVNDEGTVTMDGCHISDNIFVSVGGGIANYGTMTLTNCVITGNSADFGGGLHNGGTLSLTNCSIARNQSLQTYWWGGGGGGIENHGPLTLSTSNVTGNGANASGGGIDHYDGTVMLNDSSVMGNRANFYGGGIIAGDTLNLNHSTIWLNSSGYDGGGIWIETDAILDNGSIVIANNGRVGGGVLINDGGTIACRGGSAVVGNTAAVPPTENCWDYGQGRGCDTCLPG